MNAQQSEPAPVPHHWVLSLAGSVRGQDARVSYQGVENVLPGQTRSMWYGTLRAHVLKEVWASAGAPLDNPVTIFFAIEPDQL